MIIWQNTSDKKQSNVKKVAVIKFFVGLRNVSLGLRLAANITKKDDILYGYPALIGGFGNFLLPLGLGGPEPLF